MPAGKLGRENDTSSMISVSYTDSAISVTSVSTHTPTRTSSTGSSSRVSARRVASSPVSSTARSSISSDVSTSTTATATTASSKKYRFDTAPKLVKTPWEADRSKRAFPRQWQADSENVAARPTTARGQTAIISARIFMGLPAEVYDCILDQLEDTAFSEKTGACLSCYLGDLWSLCLVSRNWDSRARQKLYTKLWILINDSASRFDRSGTPFLRIKLLRRTLRERPVLAKFVREINVPGAQIMYKKSNYIDQFGMINALASLVMACPNLERLTGLVLPFDHEYDRLSHALATRPNLKEKVWVLKGIEEGYDSIGAFRTNARPVRYDGCVANGDVFLDSHNQWSRLETLVLFGQDTGNLDYRAFVGTFRALTGSLKHLLISGFNATQFNDRTMAALPHSLVSLRLQDLPGVTERGLNRLKDSSNETMVTLSLLHLEIKSAKLIAQYMASMTKLKKFALVQTTSPLWPNSDANGKSSPASPVISGVAPGTIYGSQSLEFLHWDISPFFHPSLSHLASSISCGAFPSLKAIRAPCDDGTLQALCRPRASIARPADIDAAKAAASLGLRSSSLAGARVEAQKRLEAAREAPLMHILVTDDKGKLVTRYNVKRFVGSVHSRIDYILEGDGEMPEPRLSEMGANVYCRAGSIASGAIGFVPPGMRAHGSAGDSGIGAAGGALMEADALLATGPMIQAPVVPSKSSLENMSDGPGSVRTRNGGRPGTANGGANGGAAQVGQAPKTCSGGLDGPSLSFNTNGMGSRVPGGYTNGGKQQAGHVTRERVRMLKTEMFF